MGAKYRFMPVSFGSVESQIHEVLFGVKVYYPVIVVDRENGGEYVRIVGPGYLDADEAADHAETVLRQSAEANNVTLYTDEVYN